MEANDDIFDTTKLSFAGDFDSQIQELMQYVRLTRDEVEQLQTLLDDLEHTLHSEWPDCKIYAFGSIITGLGIKTSDVDCYVDLPAWQGPPDEVCVRRARKILGWRRNIFQNVFAITHAKVPIVKFYHMPTGRNCDVSFKSPAGVENSKLLAYWLQSDSRILPLTITIKYWSKVHNLTGTNLMTNYSLILLVVFYLQQKNILPSVQFLQKKVQKFFINSWNVAFNAENHVNTNEESLFQLLKGFFEYYSTFDYEKFIVCPYLGRLVEKKLFNHLETVPNDFALYKDNVYSQDCEPMRLDSFMCIQDPFEHNRNCSVALYPKLANTIVASFKIAVHVANDVNNFLKSILTRTINVGAKKKKNKGRGIVKNKNKRPHNLSQHIITHITKNRFR
ncbi:UTP:RNA uridylyltransferase 1-like [Aricia agestis]|uniref:UTP:RNA uridylyltransferase 1-like n=1 Tax=Aricia agestis TaxID=91739 RepID=UPI001C2080D5|nr:UTP:RNA uridylyltransferase 1-like [Aricia agestis]